jgi:two-component system chemotaxis response regulator CheB
MTSPIRVLITDDSPFYRRLFSQWLGEAEGIEVVGVAADPLEARQKIKELCPDVLTLDVEMPHMDGLSFLEKIMTLRPMPVVMVSTLTGRGTEATLQALALGAVDCLAKPQGSVAGEEMAHFAQRLVAMVRGAAGARVGRIKVAAATSPHLSDVALSVANRGLIAIAASTGGVEALHALLPRFPKVMPPMVIVQHMPPGFTASFARRLDAMCALTVQEAMQGLALRPGLVCIAPGGRHVSVARTPDGTLRCHLADGPSVSGHRPSADVLFSSVAGLSGVVSTGVILTGMGSDGSAGLLAMRRAGALTFGQNEASCVVYGMPRAAWLAGAVETEMPLMLLAEAIHRASLRG